MTGTSWGEEVARRRIARAAERGSASLWLTGLALDAIPEEVRRLRHLRSLHLRHNRIEALPDWLPELSGLTRLTVEDSGLGHLPDWIGELSELRYLQLAGNPITELPESMLRLEALAGLDLGNTDLRRVPEWLTRLPSLRALYVGALVFEELPDWFARLTQLTALGIERCGLDALPPWFAGLSRLSRLGLADNRFTEIPGVLRRLGGLEILDVESNAIGRLPEWIGELEALRVLNAGGNRLRSLPESFGGLSKLMSLDLKRNRFEEVPETLATLRRLRTLLLGHNKLTGVPPFLSELKRIQRLDLGGGALTEVPDTLRGLRNLTELWLDFNQLDGLPEWIGEHLGLRTLSVAHNRVTVLPDLSRLSHLETLYLNNNLIHDADVPALLGTLPSLRHLQLDRNPLRALPENPPRYRRLQRLSATTMSLARLPDWVARLPRLRSLDVSDNEITEIPEALRGHPRLAALFVDRNPVRELPEWLGAFPSLNELGIGSPTLARLPGWVRTYDRLAHLWIHDSAITRLPDWLGELRGLRFLILWGNPLHRLPDSIAQLRRLVFLNLNGTALTELPERIGELGRLSHLSVEDTALARIPDSIGSLQRLETLYLSGGKLTRLPSAIGGLRSLRELRVADNDLHAISSAVGQLKRLRTLELQKNRLTELPNALLDLPMLDELTVHGNPLLSPPPEIGAAGMRAVLDFLAERKKGSAWRWESKLLVVGEGGVGKTSMIKRLLGDGFDPDESTTHGMRTYRYALAHPRREDVDMSLNVWDFGGQEIYHATHQFFLTDRSLFVLLWNGRLGWEQGRLRYWLDIIRARAPESLVLLVATHAPADGRSADLPLADLLRDYPQVVGNLSIDNETGDGFGPLVELIGATAAGLPLMGTEWPRSWLDAAEAVQRIPDDHVTPYRLWRTMAEAGLHDTRHQRYVAEALHALGTILYHAEDPELRDTVILRPEWVNEYISRVLDDPEVERCHGLLRRSRLDELWGELDRGMRDHFLAMMDTYDLSYKTGIEQGEDVSLVVERLSWQAADCGSRWDAAPAADAEPEHEIRVVYELNTMPPGIPTWFIARSHRFSTNTHWRTGALLAHPDGRHRALIRSDRDRKRVELAVRGPAPAGFFALLDDGLNVTLKRYPGLSIRCMVPCPCTPGCAELFDYRDLQRRMTRPKPLFEIECRKSNEMVHVPLLLLGLPPSDRDEIRVALKQISGQNTALDGRLTELVGDQQRMFLKLQQQVHSGLETKCPSVFAITAVRQGERLHKDLYELRLYCEEPGAWHPLPQAAGGVYGFSRLPAWLLGMAPHLRTVLGLLKHAAPLASPLLGAGFEQLDDRLKADVELMTAFVDLLPAFDTPVTERPRLADPGEGGGAGTPPPARPSNEADFRALENLLAELDPRRVWGGLSRVTTPEGLTLYLCPRHADSYKP